MVKQEKQASKQKKVDATNVKEKKSKRTMKMQKKHAKGQKEVKDSQVKIGVVKKIHKIATDASVVVKERVKKVKKEEKPKVAEPLVQLRDTVKDSLAYLKKTKIDQGALKKAVQRLTDKSQRVPLKDTPKNCTIYVGHLPYGLMEEQLKTYFTQYGDINVVKLARSRKTARSKGFAFIKFDHPEVAAIAAKAMHGHMVLGKVLQVHVLTDDQKNPFDFKDGKKQFKFINWKRQFVKQTNTKKSEEETKKQVQKLLKNEKKRREQLEKLGINYEFPGFEAIVKGVAEVEQEDEE